VVFKSVNQSEGAALTLKLEMKFEIYTNAAGVRMSYKYKVVLCLFRLKA
jgi:hypothetical protein